MDFSLSSSLVGSAVSNPDKLALDLQFATDKTLTARKGPTPVFVRGSGATFVDSDGLIKWAPENLVLRSNELANTLSWAGVAMTPTANATIAPDGTLTGVRLDATSLLNRWEQGVVVTAGLSYVFSFYAKKGTALSTVARIWNATSGGAIVTLNYSASTSLTQWVRIQIPFTVPAGCSGVALRIRNDDSVGDAFYWGAQLERSSTARTYNPTTTAVFYGPRFDHDPVTGVCKGLLMEESRTNIMPRSQDFTTGWTVTNLQTVTSGFTSPSGDSTACSLIENNLSGIHSVQLASPSAVTAGSPYTASVYAKENGETSFQLIFSTTGLGAGHANFVLSGNGSIGTFSGVTATIERLANGWYRCSMTVASAPGSGANSSILVVALNDNNSSAARIPSYLGDNATGVLVWGAQLEIGAFPTSYIPTTTGTLARSADVCSISSTAFSNMWNRFSGTVVMRATEAGNENSRWISTDVGQRTFDIIGKTNLKFFEGGGGTTTNIVNVITLPATIGLAYAVNDYQSAYNGLLGGSDTNTGATFPNPTFLDIGRLNTLQQLCGCISFIRYYKKRLPNSKLASLTV